MKNWSFTEGVIHYADNIDGGSQIFTVGEWRDFDLELEYKVGSNTNGGIYLKGLVQIQVRPPTGKRYKGEDGAIYETKAPDCTASKLVGAWNQLRIIWRRRTVSVYLNDITIHNQVELHKPTKAYLSKSLTGEGPIMLERSSGAVWYRNIRLRPAP